MPDTVLDVEISKKYSPCLSRSLDNCNRVTGATARDESRVPREQAYGANCPDPRGPLGEGRECGERGWGDFLERIPKLSPEGQEEISQTKEASMHKGTKL